MKKTLPITDRGQVKDQVYPEKIVSLSPSNTEILFAIGAGSKVVGVTDYCNYPPHLKTLIESDDIQTVGGYWNHSIQSIMTLEPDLVVISTLKCTNKMNMCKVDCGLRCEINTRIANQLEKLGVDVLTIAPHSMDEVLNNILLIGEVTGNSVEAGNLVKKLKKRIASIVVPSKSRTKAPGVYFEVWNNPYMTVNSRTWIGDLIILTGGINVFGKETSEWPIIQSEEVVERNPDIIFFPVIPDVPRFWESFEAVKRRPEWENIDAVRNKRLYEIPRDLISRPGPRLVEALEIMANAIHPSS